MNNATTSKSPENKQKNQTFVTGVAMQQQAAGKDIIKDNPKKGGPISLRIDSASDYGDKINANNERNILKKKATLFDKIKFPPPDDKYYEKIYSIYHITPGILFFKKLFSHPRAEEAIASLKINVPETYWNDTEMYYVYNDPKNNFMLKMIKNKKDFNFFEKIKNVESAQYKREFTSSSKMEPFLVIRGKLSDYETLADVWWYEKAHENLGKDFDDKLVQRYIRCKGRNRELDKSTKSKVVTIKREPTICPPQNEGHYMSIQENNDVEVNDDQTTEQVQTSIDDNNNNGEIFTYEGTMRSKSSKLALKNIADERKKSLTKPTIVRLEYKTGFNQVKGPNIAYCLISKTFVEPAVKAGTKEIRDKYRTLVTLTTDIKNSFEIFVMSGESVRPYEFYANEIVQYVQKWYRLLMKTIVIDFIKDERGIIYFLGVKSFTLVKDIDDQGIYNFGINCIKVQDEKNIKKFYKTWTCRLCQLPYPKHKITKIVTFKLLIKLKENLAKRKCTLFNHIHDNIYNESLSCRVCDLCYTLLVTEQELMEVQKTIALCNNIDVQSEEQLTIKDQSPENLVPSIQKFKTLNQWRILFYFVRFYCFNWEKLLFDETTNYKLYIKIFNQKVGIPIFTEMKKFISNDEIEINLSKIFYFFSNENSNLKQILKNEEVDFRIVLNEDWNNPIAQCQTTCFSCYDEGIREKAIQKKTILNLFSHYVQHFKCQVHVGLKDDGPVLTETLPMFCYKLPNNIFLTDLDYYSYHPMPNDWYELFLPPDTNIEEEKYVDIEEEIDKIINNLEGGDTRTKKEDEEEVYDPYKTLVELQTKNNTINKIKSIPIIQDKTFIENKREGKKVRPNTSMLRNKFSRESMPEGNEKLIQTKNIDINNTNPNDMVKTQSKHSSKSNSFAANTQVKSQRLAKLEKDDLIARIDKELELESDSN